MKIIIFPKVVFRQMLEDKNITDETVESFNRTAFISIIDPDRRELLSRDHPNFITTKFWDIEETFEIPGVEILEPISKEQAEQIVDFVLFNIEKVDSFIVHCSAGVSRSGAVGTFILDLLQRREYSREQLEDFKRTNPSILPNSYVLRLLNNTLNERTGSHVVQE